MPSTPETRESLILRLPTQSDAQAWREFVAIYEPLLYRFAKRRGLQDADAREIAQNVFVSVAGAIDRWTPDRQRGPFRAWLFRIARNHLINYVAKHQRLRAKGGSDEWSALQRVSARSSEQEEFEQDYRRELFRLAASEVKESIAPHTWEAFWRTAVLGKTAEQTSQELQMTIGTIYVAKCRVTAKIKFLVDQWEGNDEV